MPQLTIQNLLNITTNLKAELTLVEEENQRLRTELVEARVWRDTILKALQTRNRGLWYALQPSSVGSLDD